MGYVLNITRPMGLMCWCAESQMKWQRSQPTERNENIVFWINRNGVNLHRMWAKATFPAVLFRQCSGIFFKPAWQCFLCCGWALKNRLYLFIYLYLLRLVWPSVLGCFFRNSPLHPHSVTHIRTSGSQGFPTVVHRAFLLDQPGVNCLAQGHFHKSYLGMFWLFLLLCPHVPSSGIWRNLVKSPILWASLVDGAEIGRERKAFWVSFRVFCSTLWMTCSQCSIGMS